MLLKCSYYNLQLCHVPLWGEVTAGKTPAHKAALFKSRVMTRGCGWVGDISWLAGRAGGTDNRKINAESLEKVSRGAGYSLKQGIIMNSRDGWCPMNVFSESLFNH